MGITAIHLTLAGAPGGKLLKNDGYMEHHPYPCVFFLGGGTPGSNFLF